MLHRLSLDFKNTKLIDGTEMQHFRALKSNIHDSNKVTENDILSIFDNIWKKRANYGASLTKGSFLKLFIISVFPCCIRKEKNKKEFLTFKNGIRKFNKELDVINLLRSTRLSKIL
jgi:hypothetical protein